MPKTLYYVAFVSPRSDRGVLWSRPLDTLREAGAECKRVVADEGAVFAVVVEFVGGRKTPLADEIFPRSARATVKHWLDIWDATE